MGLLSFFRETWLSFARMKTSTSLFIVKIQIPDEYQLQYVLFCRVANSYEQTHECMYLSIRYYIYLWLFGALLREVTIFVASPTPSCRGHHIRGFRQRRTSRGKSCVYLSNILATC